MRKFDFIFIAFALIFVACGGGGGGGDAGPSAPNTYLDEFNDQEIGPGLSPTNSTEAKFDYSTDKTNVSYQCRLDAAGWSTCNGGSKTYPGLTDGEHTFEVKAYYYPEGSSDAVYDNTPASFTWIIDTAGPSISLDIVPNDPTNATSGQISFTHDGVSAVSYTHLTLPTSDLV